MTCDIDLELPSDQLSEPLYLQVRELVLKRIVNGDWRPGDRLPPDRDLAAQLKINPVTLGKALNMLRDEGCLNRRQGRGTFIADPLVRPKIKESHSFESHGKLLFIGALDHSIRDYGSIIASGAQYQAHQCGYELESVPLEYVLYGNSKLIQDQHASGIILNATAFSGNEKIIDILKGTGLPILLPHGYQWDLNTSGFDLMLYVDHRQALLKAMQYLKQKGHCRCAYIGCGLFYLGYPSRKDLVTDAKKCGIEITEELIAEMEHFSPEDIDLAVDAVWKERPTAILCSMDAVALGAYAHFSILNLKIPEDISVIALGGNIGGEFLEPRLTVIDYNFFQLGKDAVDYLLRLVRQEELPERMIQTQIKLLERGSCRAL